MSDLKSVILHAMFPAHYDFNMGLFSLVTVIIGSILATNVSYFVIINFSKCLLLKKRA